MSAKLCCRNRRNNRAVAEMHNYYKKQNAVQEGLLLSDMPILILLIPRPSPVVVPVVPHHGNGLFNKWRPHHGAIKDHILLSVNGAHKESLSLLSTVLVYIAADVRLMLEGAHFAELLVDDVHALHGIRFNYNSILTNLQCPNLP